MQECCVPAKHMQNFCVCIELAIKDPTTLDRGLPTTLDKELAIHLEVESAESKRQKANDGLDLFMLKPKSKTGMDLFKHMVERRHLFANDNSLSAHLQVDLTLYNRKRLSESSSNLVAKRQILQRIAVEKNKMKAAKRNLDGTGKIKNHCSFANDERNLWLLKNKQELEIGLAQIEELHRKQAEEKKKAPKENMQTLAPKAKDMLQKKQMVSALTKAEIVAILTVFFHFIPDPKLFKGSLVLELEDKIAGNPQVLEVQLKPKAGPVAGTSGPGVAIASTGVDTMPVGGAAAPRLTGII